MEDAFWVDCPAVETVEDRLGSDPAPVVLHSRVRADTIVECDDLGETPEEISADYRVPLEKVKAILAYYHAHSSQPPHAR